MFNNNKNVTVPVTRKVPHHVLYQGAQQDSLVTKVCFDASPHMHTDDGELLHERNWPCVVLSTPGASTLQVCCSYRLQGPRKTKQNSAIHTGCKAQGKLVLATLSKEYCCSCRVQGPRKTSVSNTKQRILLFMQGAGPKEN